MSQAEQSLKLFNAIERSDRKFARKLILEERVEVTDMGQKNLNALLKMAVESRDALLVRKILELKPHLNTAYGARILWIVAEDGDTEIASMLVRAGANVDINNPCHPNFLHVFATSSSLKKLELAVLMMEHGADVAAEDIDGYTALTYAICHENFNFAKELLKRDAVVEECDIEAAVFSDNTMKWMKLFAEDYLCNEVTRKDRLADIFSWLCKFDFDVERIANCLDALLEVDIPYVSVICNVVSSEKIVLVKTILDSHRVDRSVKMMLLHAAVALKDTTIARMLIEWGADINYRLKVDFDYFPASTQPIHIACANQSEENIKLLLRLGADINVTDIYGITPLCSMMYSARKNEPNLSVACQLVIKHLAMSAMEGVELNEIDLNMIHDHPDIHEFYENCLKELRDMKRFKVLNTFEFYSILTTDVKNLSILTKRQKFANNCNRDLLDFLFPLYCEELILRVSEAETRRDLLSHTEEVLYDTLAMILPDLVIQKIMFHLYMF